MSTSLGSLVLSGLGEAIRRPALGKYLADTFDELPMPLSSWLGTECMGLVQVDRFGHEIPEEALDLTRPHEPLSDIQFNVLRHVEQVYYQETYDALRAHERDVRWRPARFVNFVWMMVGKGGGKDRVAALAHLRIAYLLMCLKSPQKYQRIGSTSKIDLLNTASSEGQAEAIYFAELKGFLDTAPWFRGRYKYTGSRISYDKRIWGHSGNSKEESQEGMNLIFGCLDEIDAFRTKAELEKTARTSRGAMLNAEGIFEMMRTSGASRFPSTFKVMGLSWPRFVGSFIWTKHKQGLADFAEKGQHSRTYVIPSEHGAATWEANPTKRFEDYAADFEENPELANAKYACRPPESESPYFRNRDVFEQAFSPMPKVEPVSVEYYWGAPPANELEEGPLGYRPQSDEVLLPEGWQVKLKWRNGYVAKDSTPRAIHVDTGITNDRCGIAMSHVRGFTTTNERRATKCERCDGVGRLRKTLAICPECGGHREHVTEVTVRRPLVTVDFVMYFEAPKPTAEHPRGEVELRWVRRLIFEVIGRGFNVQRVSFDGYQSTDSRQLLEAHGVHTEYLSLDRNLEGYDTAKSILYAGGLRCAAHPLLVEELKALTIVRGLKVDHPPNGSKDLADAWAGSIFGAVSLAQDSLASVGDVLIPGERSQAETLSDASPATLPAISGIPSDLQRFSSPPSAR